jgi:tetratricopeptide (TPR) repeat protein
MRLLQAAETAWNNRDFQQTIDQLERASRLDPANWQILLQLGRVYGLRYDYAAAERCFERAIRLVPKKAAIMAAAGEHAVDFASPKLAEHYFRKAIEQSDASAESFVGLAGLYEHLHRTGEAAGLIDRALQSNPECFTAWLAKARLDRQEGRVEEAEPSVRRVIQSPDQTTRVRGFYELGMILDRAGRYDEAMAAFLDAKALLRDQAKPWLEQLKVFREYWGEMQAKISPETFQRWFDAAPLLGAPRRIAYLGGYPRSGTTLLEQILDSHPDVVSAEETTLFNDEVYIPLSKRRPPETSMLDFLESAQPDDLKQLRSNYLEQIQRDIGSPIGTRLVIDKHPSMNVLIPTFIRAFPEIKLLIALRDPRDVCLSCFVQTHVPLNKASAEYMTLEGVVEGYTRTMGLLLTLLPMLEGHYLEVRYEDVVENVEQEAKRTLDFLGIPWDERVLRFDEHAKQKKVRSPTYADVAKPISKRAMGRWQKYQKYFEPHLEKLAPFLKAFGYD